jgi:hypothetical protein
LPNIARSNFHVGLLAISRWRGQVTHGPLTSGNIMTPHRCVCRRIYSRLVASPVSREDLAG